MLKTGTYRTPSTKGRPCSRTAICTALEAQILLHLILAEKCLIKRKAVSAHILPATGNMIGFVVQIEARAFMAFGRAAKTYAASRISP